MVSTSMQQGAADRDTRRRPTFAGRGGLSVLAAGRVFCATIRAVIWDPARTCRPLTLRTIVLRDEGVRADEVVDDDEGRRLCGRVHGRSLPARRRACGPRMAGRARHADPDAGKRGGVARLLELADHEVREQIRTDEAVGACAVEGLDGDVHRVLVDRRKVTGVEFAHKLADVRAQPPVRRSVTSFGTSARLRSMSFRWVHPSTPGSVSSTLALNVPSDVPIIRPTSSAAAGHEP